MAPSSLHSPEEASDVLAPDDAPEVEVESVDESADVPLDPPEDEPAEAVEAAEEAAEDERLPEDDPPEAPPVHAPLVDEAPAGVSVASEDSGDDSDEVAPAGEAAAEGVEEDEAVDDESETVCIAPIKPPPLRCFRAGGRVLLRIGPGESPEGLRASLTAASLPEGPIWLAFEERPPTPALVDEFSAVLAESGRSPAGIRCGMETLIAGSAAAMGLPVEVPPARPAEEPGRRKVMVVERTMRSGASVRFGGDVLVYGDVNAGAQIEADGNIIVLGTLRGLAHAGRSGDESALIISFDLRPTQLRIGRRIAFPPAQSRSRSPLPEVARIRDGEIVLQDFRGRLSF